LAPLILVFCALVVWCLEISGPSDELEVITTLIMPLSRSSECQSGTPIESTDTNTPAVFGNYIDVYDIAQAVEDGATVRIYYESRLAKVNLSEEGKKLVEKLDDELVQDDLTDTQKAKAKWTQLEALIGSENRIKNIAQDIVSHFEQRQEVFAGKGMIVSMSRRIAADLYAQIIKIKPDWHSDDLDKGVIKVVMTSSSSDGPEISKHHTTKAQRKTLADRMKHPDDQSHERVEKPLPASPALTQPPAPVK
jgi:type I restriction enzyme R subunit